MNNLPRREFLAAIIAAPAAARAFQANDRITVGVIGCGGMGSSHAKTLAGRKDVAVAYACDPDRNRAAVGRQVRRRGLGEGAQGRPEGDLRGSAVSGNEDFPAVGPL